MTAQMPESEYEELAGRTIEAIEAALDVAAETAGLDIDVQMKPGGVLELEFDDGSKIIVNRQAPMREIWVAARSGGFHFRHSDGRWCDTRDGSELFAALSRLVSAQSGVAVILAPRQT